MGSKSIKKAVTVGHVIRVDQKLYFDGMQRTDPENPQSDFNVRFNEHGATVFDNTDFGNQALEAVCKILANNKTIYSVIKLTESI